MMDAQLLTKLEEFKGSLHQQSGYWNKISTPSELFDFEQGLQAILNSLQSEIVGAVLEAIHRERDFVSDCQSQAMEQRGVNINWWRKVRVRTLGGKWVLLKTPYLSIRKGVNQEDMCTKRRQQGTGIYPVLRRIGIVRGVTPKFLAEVNRQITDGPSVTEVKERFESREIMLSRNPIWRHVRDFASIALWQRQVAAANLDHVKVSKPAPLSGKRVVVGLDGGRLRLRINKIGSAQTPTREYSTDKREPKLFAIYTINDKGNKEPNSEVFYDGTLQSAAELFTLLKLRFKQLGITHARELVIIGDGASWIWNGVPDLLAVLGLESLHVVEIVDWAHAVQKLMLPAKVGIQDSQKQQQWFKRARALLRQGNISAVIETLQNLDQSHDTDKIIRTTTQYFQTHKTCMQYDRFRKECLTIGSGVIESGVRRIVNLRLKGAGIFWLPENAEEILYLRCQMKSGRWVSFVKSVLTQWADDMTTSLTEAYQVRDVIATAVLTSHPPVYVSEGRQDVVAWARQVIETDEALILDTETTGLGTNDEVIQLGIVDLHGTLLLDTLLRPTVPVGTEARAVHGIADEVLTNAPDFPDMHGTIAYLLSNRPVLAYNADFDRRLLTQTCAKHGFQPFEVAEWNCVMEKYACFWEERSKAGHYKSQSLSTACAQQGIGVHGNHEASKDCLLTLNIVQAMATGDVIPFES
jgi:DNA polymerase III epsilon subunit-like protein